MPNAFAFDKDNEFYRPLYNQIDLTTHNLVLEGRIESLESELARERERSDELAKKVISLSDHVLRGLGYLDRFMQTAEVRVETPAERLDRIAKYLHG